MLCPLRNTEHSNRWLELIATDDAMGYQTIEVRKVTPVIGAEVHGVDLSKPLGNQQFQEIHDALMDNLVIFFRDQKLSVDQHADFGRKFGKLHIHPASRSPIEGHPEILLIKADETSKHVAGAATRDLRRCRPWRTVRRFS